MPFHLPALLFLRRRSLLLLSAAALSTYTLYRLYNHPLRRRLFSLLSALASSSRTLALLSLDLQSFLLSDSDQIPPTLTQLAKILQSPDLAVSISRISEALTAGIVRGVVSESGSAGSDFSGRIFSPEGAGFMSVVVGSFARNLVLAYYSGKSEGLKLGRIPQLENCEGIELRGRNSRRKLRDSEGRHQNIQGLAQLQNSKGTKLGRVAQLGDSEGIQSRDQGVRDQIAQLGDSEGIKLGNLGVWNQNLQLGDSEGVELGDGDSGLGYLIYDDRFQNLIGDCVQRFVSTGVTVYLEKTRGINSYDEIFSGLTNPRHEAKIKDVLVSMCNGAVETLVKTSHRVMVGSSECVGEDVEGVSQVVGSINQEVRSVGPSNRKVVDVGGWVSNVSSTLAVPSNRRFVLDVTGRVTFETVRSLLEFFLMKLHSAGRSVGVFREEVVERGLEVLRYISAKSMAILTICIALCVQLSVAMKLSVPV